MFSVVNTFNKLQIRIDIFIGVNMEHFDSDMVSYMLLNAEKTVWFGDPNNLSLQKHNSQIYLDYVKTPPATQFLKNVNCDIKCIDKIVSGINMQFIKDRFTLVVNSNDLQYTCHRLMNLGPYSNGDAIFDFALGALTTYNHNHRYPKGKKRAKVLTYTEYAGQTFSKPVIVIHDDKKHGMDIHTINYIAANNKVVNVYTNNVNVQRKRRRKTFFQQLNGSEQKRRHK